MYEQKLPIASKTLTQLQQPYQELKSTEIESLHFLCRRQKHLLVYQFCFALLNLKRDLTFLLFILVQDTKSGTHISSPWRCSLKKVFLKILQLSQESTCVRVYFRPEASNFTKRDSNADGFTSIKNLYGNFLI